MNGWVDDKVISKLELQGIKDEKVYIVADKSDIDKQVEKYDLTSNTYYTNFGTYYNNYLSNLNTIINGFTGTTETVSIPNNFATNQSNYYNTRTLVLDAISTAAKKVATDAQATADTAKTNAATAQATANTALSASFSEEKKQQLAESLGYVDYNAFLNSENKIIKNGYINTGLINADAIVTDELISSKIAAATIAANSVKTINASTTGSCELDGSTFNIISASGDKFIEMGEFDDSDFEQVKQSAKSEFEIYTLKDDNTVTKFSVSNGKNSKQIIHPIMTCPAKTTLHIESLIIRLKYGTSSVNTNLFS
jgi:hypothetical protein